MNSGPGSLPKQKYSIVEANNSTKSIKHLNYLNHNTFNATSQCSGVMVWGMSGKYIGVSAHERFLAFTVKGDGCWTWLGFSVGTKNGARQGYGMIRVGKTRVRVHRYAYEFYNGKIPFGMHVMHKCDNNKCVNPAHLKLGTNVDNIADKVAKRRTLFGEKQPHAKLSNSQVRLIRADKISLQRDLAKKFNVCRPLISLIQNNKIRTRENDCSPIPGDILSPSQQ